MKCAWTFCFTIHELKISDTVPAPCMNLRWSSWKNTCKYFNILFQQLVRKQQPWKFSNIVNNFQFFPLKVASCFNWRNEAQLQINCLNSFSPRGVKKSPIFLGPIQTPHFSWVEPEHIELSTWKIRRLSQLGAPSSIWNGSAVLSAWPRREFRLWSDFGTALIQNRTALFTYRINA